MEMLTRFARLHENVLPMKYMTSHDDYMTDSINKALI